jgi:hypothetical protein
LDSRRTPAAAKLVLSFALVSALAAAPAWPQQAWTGVISDSMCVLHHESGAEGQDTTDEDCTRDCVRGGSRYVLIVEKQVFAIANQDHEGLAAHAGRRVRVSGSRSGETITVERVAAVTEG